MIDRLRRYLAQYEEEQLAIEAEDYSEEIANKVEEYRKNLEAQYAENKAQRVKEVGYYIEAVNNIITNEQIIEKMNNISEAENND